MRSTQLGCTDDDGDDNDCMMNVIMMMMMLIVMNDSLPIMVIKVLNDDGYACLITSADYGNSSTVNEW